jgi:hypothetical protein
LINGKIQIYEVPSSTHEVAARDILCQLRDQNRCVSSNGSGTLTFDDVTRLEPDESVFICVPGLAIPGALDIKGVRLPKVVIEVSFREDYTSIFSLPEKYFSIDNGVRAVILIIIRRNQSNKRVRQLIACYYSHNENIPIVVRSFGLDLHVLTKNAIIRHSGLQQLNNQEIANRFRGVGIMYNGQDDPRCDQNGIALYQLTIPSGELWFGYDYATREINNGVNDSSIDLFQMHNLIMRTEPNPNV